MLPPNFLIGPNLTIAEFEARGPTVRPTVRSKDLRTRQEKGTQKTLDYKSRKQAVWDVTGGRCWYCGVGMQRHYSGKAWDSFTIDHVFPVHLGGASKHLDNLVPSCKSCNEAKGVMSLNEFRCYMKAFWGELGPSPVCAKNARTDVR